MTNIGEKTKIPIVWAAFALAFFITTGSGGIAWLTTMHSDLAQAKQDIVDGKSRDAEIMKTERRLERRLIKIEIKMGIPVEDSEDDSGE